MSENERIDMNILNVPICLKYNILVGNAIEMRDR